MTELILNEEEVEEMEQDKFGFVKVGSKLFKFDENVTVKDAVLALHERKIFTAQRLSIVTLKLENDVWKEIDRNPDEDSTFAELNISCSGGEKPEYCIFIEQMAKGGH